MIGSYSKPSWDPRFGELDNLIAKQNRQEKKSKNLVTITDAEHTQRQIEHTARVKREVGARAQAKKKLLAPRGSPEAGGSEGLRMIEAHLRPGYTALATVLKNGREPKEWDALVTNILQLPLWMLPAVQIVLSKGSWRKANDPLKCVRENARRQAIRMGLNGKPAAKGE